MGFLFGKKKYKVEKSDEIKSTAQTDGNQIAEVVDPQTLERLKEPAGSIIEMLKGVFKTERGIDIQRVVLYASGLAGIACHEAVKANRGSFQVAETKDGKKYYFGDDLNKYLLESQYSVNSFCDGIHKLPEADTMAIVQKVAATVGTDNFKIWNSLIPADVYKQVKSCWDGIFDNMIGKNCQSAAEWPVLMGIVLQNVMATAFTVAPKDEVAKMAKECAFILSKMDQDSI